MSSSGAGGSRSRKRSKASHNEDWPTDHEEEEEESEEESEEELWEEEIVPQRSKQLPIRGGKGKSVPKGKKPAARGSAPKPGMQEKEKTMLDIPDAEFTVLREENPYARARALNREHSRFYTEFQERVYKEVYLDKGALYVNQKFISLAHMDANPDYFGEAKNICFNVGMKRIMECRQDFDPQLIAQFYATVHFCNGNDRKMIWMTRTEKKEATLAEFGAVLGYPDRGLNTPSGFRCHTSTRAMAKDVLRPLYIGGRGIAGNIKHLKPTWDIINRVYRETIAVKAGNVDQIHGHSVDLLFHTYANQRGELKVDVMDYLWHEMRLAALGRRTPPFAPYIMKLIIVKDSYVRRSIATNSLSLVSHKHKDLLIKKHEKPLNADGQEIDEDGNVIVEAEDDEETDPDYVVPQSSPPSWLKKLFNKAKKAFCLQQNRAYEDYTYRRRNDKKTKAIMQHLGLEVSEEHTSVTVSKDRWIAANCPWTDDDDDDDDDGATSSYQPPP